MTLLVTGGAGFIGANFVHSWLARSDELIVNLDLLTYAGSMENLAALDGDPRHVFVEGDIADRDRVARLLETHRPRAILNFAAESHVDRSIDGPAAFIQTNVVGTFELLEAARRYLGAMSGAAREAFRFVHISTDEVFGALGADDAAFAETTPYAPNSPYSASKAASDHLGRAYFHTFGLPVIVTNCSNNYGPFQHPEKLIPTIIRKALAGEPIPIYGDGSNVREWLHVADHCAALRVVLEHGRAGESYNIGSASEARNLDVATSICALLDEMEPVNGRFHADRITMVSDRPGHDFRYAMDCSKIAAELGWRAQRNFADGLRETVRWYLDNRGWMERSLARSS